MKNYLLVALFFAVTGCDYLKGKIVNLLGAPDKYKVEGDATNFTPKFSGADATRAQIPITLREVASGFKQITDIQFPPGENTIALVAEKTGGLFWLNLKNRKQGLLKQFDVISAAEEGLLGIAFHPQFKINGKIYFNYMVAEKGDEISRVSEFTASDTNDLSKAKLGNERVLMVVVQPYPNHNAGQLAFGPDGMLYVGWGDGGFRNDPKGHGQNPKTLLGSMLRIDTSGSDNGRAYKIPADNPFVNTAGFAPETFAYGFRNPWRYSFDHKGRLIVADVGQDLWEEVDIVVKGGNYGWNIREGMHCFEPKENCATQNLRDPVYEYGRAEGQSITGGYVYTGDEIRELKNRYVFADFVSGRLWAIDLPEKPDGKAEKAFTLGQWPLLPSTFGRDAGGNIYVADFGTGKIFRLAAK